ncbi:MAG TPA: extracellular solute-binding protein [Thermoanaerobaculia bacterium]|jgi:multiple sugar transport system substrate-binding protein
MSSKRNSRRGLSRREFVSGAAALAAAAFPAACRPTHPAAAAKKTLKILQWSHFVPAFDEWFDRRYTKSWGEKNGVDVVVDHVAAAELPARAASEATAGKGHDLFLFQSPPAAYEERVHDLRDVVEAVENKHGRMLPLAQRSTFNPKTGRYYAFSHSYTADPGNYRIDLWRDAGFPRGPDTWEDLRVGGGKIRRATGICVGIGFSQEPDSNMALRGLLWSFGGAEQDEEGRVTIGGSGTVEALKFARALYQETMTPEVFTWDPSSNNRMILAGRGSFVQNAISVTRAGEKTDPDMARRIGLTPALAGPVRRLACEHIMHCYVIWKFADQPDLARKFLVDMADDLPAVFRESEFYNLPCFPGTVPDLADRLATDPRGDPPGKYSVLASALDWSTNVGYPGFATAAMDEAFNKFLVPTMFARVVRGEVAPEVAARAADQELRRIVDRWTAPAS